MSMKYPNDTIGNRIRDLPARSTVPQPNALTRVPHYTIRVIEYKEYHPSDCLKFAKGLGSEKQERRGGSEIYSDVR
jgi:hypothetical protein